MKWRKLGRVYVPDGTRAWAQKFAFPPTPYRMPSGELRVYVAFCDERTVGRLGFVDLDPAAPTRVLSVSAEPLLDIGQPGTFDENGVVPTCATPVGDELLLYYVGYQLGYQVRYYQFEGLATSRDGVTFRRHGRVPIIDRSEAECLNRTSAFVLHEGGRFRMWYVGGSDWVEARGKQLPRYNLKYLESPDGRRWGPEGTTVLDFASDDEHALGRPWVLHDGGRYRMFYSVRTHSKGYRMGYAESPDGIAWTRLDDQVGLDVSDSGWDSEMVAYASIVALDDQVYMLYNGNGCGATGFGIAVLESW